MLGGAGVSPFEGPMDDFVARLQRYPIVRRENFGEDVMTVYAIHEV
jgi:hypothetical protein